MNFDAQVPVQVRASALPAELARTSERAFMSTVYRWMVGALALTGFTALYVTSNVALTQWVLSNYWLLLIAELGAVIFLSVRAHKLSAAVAGSIFLAYALLNGLTFSAIFLAYTLGSVAQVFFVTAGSFAALSVYGTVTKRDLTAWRSFLVMGLIGVLIAFVVQIFVQSPMLSFVASCAGVLVFAGLTAYDTQKLKAMHAEARPGSSLAVNGALTLYLDFINLFLMLLRLFGSRR